jgi:hypothetical protein
MWTYTGALRVAIEEPEMGLNGKTHVLRLRGSGRRTAEEHFQRMKG